MRLIIQSDAIQHVAVDVTAEFTDRTPTQGTRRRTLLRTEDNGQIETPRRKGEVEDSEAMGGSLPVMPTLQDPQAPNSACIQIRYGNARHVISRLRWPTGSFRRKHEVHFNVRADYLSMKSWIATSRECRHQNWTTSTRKMHHGSMEVKGYTDCCSYRG